MTKYSTLAIACGLSDVAGWLENEGWIPKHVRQIRAGAQRLLDLNARARPLSEWTEEDGNVLWWVFPITEAPYCGSPLDVGRTCEITLRLVGEEHVRHTDIGGWPGYHTHWTPIPYPDEPPAPCDEPPKGEDAPSAAEGRSPASAVGESRGAHE